MGGPSPRPVQGRMRGERFIVPNVTVMAVSSVSTRRLPTLRIMRSIFVGELIDVRINGATVMQKYEFTLVLNERDDSLDDVDALYEAGCTDGLISTSGGVTRIDFGREASSLEEAIRSAIADVEKTRFRVVCIESDAVETIATINTELSRGPSA